MGVILIIILVTSVVSIIAFNDGGLVAKFEFNAWSIVHRKQYIRLISHGFIHAGWMHLIINMFVLWSFSGSVIYYLEDNFQGKGVALYLILYVTALINSSLASLIKEKDNPNYNAIGASGAVSAVVFTSIFFDPYAIISIYGIIPVPGIVLGIGYLIYSKIMAKKKIDNVGHDAHFYGALYGFIFPLIFRPVLIEDFIKALFSVF